VIQVPLRRRWLAAMHVCSLPFRGWVKLPRNHPSVRSFLSVDSITKTESRWEAVVIRSEVGNANALTPVECSETRRRDELRQDVVLSEVSHANKVKGSRRVFLEGQRAPPAGAQQGIPLSASVKRALDCESHATEKSVFRATAPVPYMTAARFARGPRPSGAKTRGVS
jgi:hypothetical protein